jgi:hypothetical protein
MRFVSSECPRSQAIPGSPRVCTDLIYHSVPSVERMLQRACSISLLFNTYLLPTALGAFSVLICLF